MTAGCTGAWVAGAALVMGAAVCGLWGRGSLPAVGMAVGRAAMSLGAAVAVPVPEFFKLPTDPANPWSVGLLPPEVKPDPVPKNMEYGARFSCFLGGIDFSLMALRTWTKMPELQ